MANIWEKAISILAGNLNLGRSYLIVILLQLYLVQLFGFTWIQMRLYKKIRTSKQE